MTSCEHPRVTLEVVSSTHSHDLVWSSGEEPEGWCLGDAGEGKAGVGEVCLFGRREPEEKAQSRALGGGSLEGGIGRRKGN